MGDYLEQTLRKCILGTVDAIVHDKPISPSTEENCAVAKRELEELNAKPHRSFRKLQAMHPKEQFRSRFTELYLEAQRQKQKQAPEKK